MDEIVSRHLEQAIVHSLRQFIHDHAAFRAVMRGIGAVLSGSFALQFLDRDRQCQWTPAGLDVYVPNDYGRRLIYYITRVEHYTAIHSSCRPYPHTVQTFSHIVSLVHGPNKINVIISNTASALHPIARSWASHLVNFITADGFTMAYPQLTLAGRAVLYPGGLIDTRHPRESTRRLMEKYEQRGYSFRVRPSAFAEDPNVVCYQDANCPRTARFFGDEYCLSGSFFPQSKSTHPGGLPDRFTILWWRGGDVCGMDCEYSPDDVSTFVPYARTLRARPLLRSGATGLIL